MSASTKDPCHDPPASLLVYRSERFRWTDRFDQILPVERCRRAGGRFEESAFGRRQLSLASILKAGRKRTCKFSSDSPNSSKLELRRGNAAVDRCVRQGNL